MGAGVAFLGKNSATPWGWVGGEWGLKRSFTLVISKSSCYTGCVMRPRLAALTSAQIRHALGVSLPYALKIRLGRLRPHPRLWHKLARLAGLADVPDF